MTRTPSTEYRKMSTLHGQHSPRLPVGYFFRVKVERAGTPLRVIRVQVRKERFPWPSKKVAESLRIIERIDPAEYASASDLVASLMRQAHRNWLASLSDVREGLAHLRGDYP